MLAEVWNHKSPVAFCCFSFINNNSGQQRWRPFLEYVLSLVLLFWLAATSFAISYPRSPFLFPLPERVLPALRSTIYQEKAMRATWKMSRREMSDRKLLGWSTVAPSRDQIFPVRDKVRAWALSVWGCARKHFRSSERSASIDLK